MKKYNLKYEANGEIVEKYNITKQEVDKFIDNLQREEESSLIVREVKEIEEEER